MNLVKDPLLSAAKVLLTFFIAVLGLTALAFTLAAPATLLFKARVLQAFADEGVKGAEAIYPSLPLVVLGLAALLALGVYFLVLLKRIVASVGEGDPFAPVNAVRLSHMGWATLAGQVASIPIGAATIWVARIVADNDPVELRDDFGFSGSTLLLTLVLFILARVFRRGAQMREELEGTV